MEANVVDKLILPLFNVSARQILDAWCGISGTFLFPSLIALHSRREAEVFELQWQRRKDRTYRIKVKIKVSVKHSSTDKINVRALFIS